MYSDTGPSCQWFTGGGTIWSDCSNSYLNHPKSWKVTGGVCSVYETLDCQTSGDAHVYDPGQGCHNYDERFFDTKNWMAVQCAAVADYPNEDLKVEPAKMVVVEAPPVANGSSPGTAAVPSRGGTSTSTATVSSKVNMAQYVPTSLVKVTTARTRESSPSATGHQH